MSTPAACHLWPAIKKVTGARASPSGPVRTGMVLVELPSVIGRIVPSAPAIVGAAAFQIQVAIGRIAPANALTFLVALRSA